jgi:nucleotide-binding universal stress UspA family protein
VLPEYPVIALETARELCEAADEQMRKEAQGLLDRVGGSLPQKLGPIVTRIETGSPAEAILAVAEDERADLIVMGARGRQAVPEMAIGSVSHAVVLHATCPTLVVKTPLPVLRRALLAVQGPEDSAAAMRFLATKPFATAVELTVLTVLPVARSVWEETPPAVESMRTRAFEGARRFVNDVASQLSALGYAATGITSAGYAADKILRESETQGADLIMIGCRARREATRILMGSIAYAVLHRAKKPILVFR